MTCMGHCESKPHVYKKIIEKDNAIRTNDRLENGLMYLY